MEKKNKVFIATSLDGYIADKNGSIDWLNDIPNPDNLDMGYGDFITQIDAIIMGRTTFETVCSFDIDWPYTKPVFVLSNTLSELSKEYKGKAFPIKGALTEILEQIHEKGYNRLYIDGGVTIQSFLKEDLIDSLTITIMPFLLGGGSPLFGECQKTLAFECIESIRFSNNIVQNTFQRKR
jgi:dihydrofolate reductase